MATRSSTRATRLTLALTLVLASAAPRAARAQDRASAEELFQLGKTAMAQEDYAKACRYFQASLNADYALGTLLNLAACHEQAGKLASAWSEYRVVEDRARRATPPQSERAQFARDRAEALRPRLARVRIVVPPEVKALDGLVVKVNDQPAQPELFDAGIPVDKGSVNVVASATGKLDRTQTVTVDRDKQTLEVTLLPLDAAPAEPSVQPAPTTTHEEKAVVTTTPRDDGRSQRTVGYVVGGVGAAALATGTVFGILASSASGGATCSGPCPEGSPELDRARGDYDRANTFGWVSNIAIGAGLVGVAAGVVLYVTAPRAATPTALTISPRPLLGGAGLTLGGTL